MNIEKYFLKVNKPAQYLGNELNSIHKTDYSLHLCFVFPEVYEIGMSSLATQIIYQLLNKENDVYIERSFAPETDMEEILRENNFPIFSLETKTPLKDFDVLMFSLSYEMTYTNVLNILNLAKININRENRNEDDPIIFAGGTGAYNPKVLEKFIDVFCIGEGEEVLVEVADILKDSLGLTKIEKLEKLSEIEGIYIPRIKNKRKIKKRVVKDIEGMFSPTDFLVPYMKIVHDRATMEVQRGCTRGCRFCQAGFIYRPVREKSAEKNLELIKATLQSTGYTEVSLSSLSSSDYSLIACLIDLIKNEYTDEHISVSLPSLRADNFSIGLAKKIEEVRKTGFTFAPEAGSQRLRDIINKGLEEEDIINCAVEAFRAGWRHLKFYFMIGLPFETYDDIRGIYNLSRKVLHECLKIRRDIEIVVSVSNFVPKAHTPFQWSKQMNIEEMTNKHNFLRDLFRREKKLKLKIHDRYLSYLEGFLSRGDEKIGELIELAWKKRAKFDGWSEHFKPKMWFEAIEELEIKEEDYLGERNLNLELPWDFINIGVSKKYLINEFKLAGEGELTPDCRNSCTNCNVCGNLDVEMDIV